MIYFDNSATTKPKDAVLETYTKVAQHYFANPSSLHRLGGKVDELLTEARKQIASMLAVKPAEIIFTSGGTESNNLAIKGMARAYRARGNHIITSSIEHPSVREVMQELETEGFQVTYLPVDKDGRVSPSDVKAAITPETILVSIMYVNNEVGSIQPIQAIGEILEKYEQIKFHVDNVQGIAKVPLDIEDAHIDLLSISGHKIHAPRGIGILYKHEKVSLHPEMLGGGQENGLRSGTSNVAGAVAFAKALRLAFDEEKAKASDLREVNKYLREQLTDIPAITIHTPAENAAPHILCFTVAGKQRGEVIVHALEKKDIYISTTSACSSRQKLASSTLKAIGVSDNEATGAVRVSLSYENRGSEAKVFIEALQEVIENLNKVVK